MSFSNEPAKNPASPQGPNGLLLVGLIGLAMIAGILFLAWLGTPRVEPAIGQRITKMDLKPLVYSEQSFTQENLAGKVTVLHFWGTWCPPCREEFPEFVKVAGEYADNDQVQFVSISSSQGPEYDLRELAETTEQFLKRYGATVPTYADPVGLTRVQIAMLMPDGSLPYPSTFVVDRNGAIAGVWIGFTPSGMREVSQRVQKLL